MRPSKTVVVTGTATAGLMLAGAAVSAAPAHAAVLPAHSPPPPRKPVPAAVHKPKPHPLARHYRVRPGDTLSGIARRFCGSPARWVSLWQANRARIKNPNLIYPHELVRLVCSTIAAMVTSPPALPPGGGTTAGHEEHLAHEAHLHRAPKVTVTGAQGVIGGQALRAIQGLVRERIDEGQDFSGTGALYPVAPGTVTSTVPNGWPGSSYILEKLDRKIDGYGYVYYAEDITPQVTPGTHVGDSTVLGDVYHGGTGIEIGFGTAVPGVAHAYGHYAEGQPTPEGEAIAALLASHPQLPAPPPAQPRHHAVVAAPAYPALAGHLSSLGYDGPVMAAIAQYLVAHGYSAAGAAGVIGCIAGESGGNPESQGSGGGGWIGWTPLPAGLVTGNIAHDIQAQLIALINYDGANGNVRELNAQPTGDAAAWYYSAHFERPAVTGSDIRSAVVQAVFSALAG